MYPHLNSSLPSSKACSNTSLLCSRLRNPTGPCSWPDEGTKRCVMTACFRLLLCLTSASVDTSPSPEKHGTTPAAHGKSNHHKRSLICQNRAQWCYKLGLNLAEQNWTEQTWSTACSSEVEHPTTNSVPELHGTTLTIFSGRLAGSPEESNTKRQKPHDAVFMYRRALSITLWKIWMATISFRQMKLTKHEESGQIHWEIRSIAHTFQHSLWQKICTLKNVLKCESFWFSYSLLFQAALDVTKISPSLASSVQPSLASTSSTSPLTHSSPFLTTTLKSATNCKVGTALLPETPSSIASSHSSLATLPPKEDMILASSSAELNILNNEWCG